LITVKFWFRKFSKKSKEKQNIKKHSLSQVQWHISVTLTTWGMKIGSVMVQGHLGKHDGDPISTKKCW
jgi:hypothetical protein